MRTCPHCQFLVVDDATTCSVCKKDLSLPREPATVGGAPFAAPGEAANESVPPASSGAPGWAPGIPGQTVPPAPGAWPAPPGAAYPPAGVAPPKNKWSTTKVLVIVGVLCLVPILGGIGLFLLGSAVDDQLSRAELVADELPWKSHEDPDGLYTLDMPGRVDVDTVEMPEGFGMASSLDAATVSDRDFGASVTRTPDVVPAGQTFAGLPFSTTAAERAVSELGIIDDAEVVDRTAVGTDDLHMQLEVHGTVQGEPAVLWSRLVIVGTDLYELNTVGSLDDRDELAAIVERMASTFTAS